MGTPYPVVVDHVQALRERGSLLEHPLVVDATGVGRPVVDMLKKQGVRRLVDITITGGDSVTSSGASYRVPKRDLVGLLQVLLQSGRLRFAAGLPLVDTLVRELLAFRVKISADTAHDSYGAWREGSHDDLVLAVALAAWYAEKGQTGRVVWAMAPTAGRG
ncbi:MAG: hypothetical protein GEU90_00540 [Gemmatimonas sp.]|nr:hypothetical protein [Gemmatimonas sp.]